MFKLVCLLTIAHATIAVALPPEEQPGKTNPRLLRDSSHIVTGVVVAVYERERMTDNYEDRAKCIAEIKVTACESGAGVKKGEVVYVRYQRNTWVAKEPDPKDVKEKVQQEVRKRIREGNAGHWNLPMDGDLVRVYLKRDADGRFDVVHPNGFEKLKQSSTKGTPGG